MRRQQGKRGRDGKAEVGQKDKQGEKVVNVKTEVRKKVD